MAIAEDEVVIVTLVGYMIASPVSVPVMPELTVSVAVIDWMPIVLRVTLKVPTPLVNVALEGRTAEASELVI